jgi:hypothetical protein
VRKIPTAFERDWEGDPSRVLDQVHEGCEWVFAGEGVATKKYDGTCLMYDGTSWWARRDVKDGKEAPPGFKKVSYDPETEKTFGWEPIENSPWVKWFNEALKSRDYEPGTYELIGPKINKNPEGAAAHTLIWHFAAETMGLLDRSYEGIKTFLDGIDTEGIVFRHPDGRMAKIKKRDFGLRR